MNVWARVVRYGGGAACGIIRSRMETRVTSRAYYSAVYRIDHVGLLTYTADHKLVIQMIFLLQLLVCLIYYHYMDVLLIAIICLL